MMDDKIDFNNVVQVQHYLMALREVFIKLKCLNNKDVDSILLEHNVKNVYRPTDEIKYRVNIDFIGE